MSHFSPFQYYSGHDPLTTGVHLGDLAVLALFAPALTAVAILGIRRRGLRG